MRFYQIATLCGYPSMYFYKIVQDTFPWFYTRASSTYIEPIFAAMLIEHFNNPNTPRM
jgi:hypothetical protein